MKIAVFGLNQMAIRMCKAEIKASSLVYNEKSPDIVVSLGGDGTFLMAERIYPGVPKLLIRDKNVCIKCDLDSFSPVIESLEQKKFKIQEFRKLETLWKGKKILSVNDVVVRNKDPIHAIRLALYVDGKKFDGQLIGDGIVVATSFGSTAYYFSITKRSFAKGIGIAFNNLSKNLRHLRLKEGSKIEVVITRGDATLSWDNFALFPSVKKGDKVRIKLSNKAARIVKIK